MCVTPRSTPNPQPPQAYTHTQTTHTTQDREVLFRAMARAFFTPGGQVFTEFIKVEACIRGCVCLPRHETRRSPHPTTPTILLNNRITHTRPITKQFFDGTRVHLYIVRVSTTPIGDEQHGEYAVCVRFEPAPPSRYVGACSVASRRHNHTHPTD